MVPKTLEPLLSGPPKAYPNFEELPLYVQLFRQYLSKKVWSVHWCSRVCLLLWRRGEILKRSNMFKVEGLEFRFRKRMTGPEV